MLIDNFLTVDGVADAICEAALKNWPDAPSHVRLMPLVDLNLGAIGTDYCIRLSHRYRIDPETVAKLVLQRMPEDLASLCSVTQGYLNVSPPPALKWLLSREPWQAPRTGRFCIVLPPATQSLGSVGYLRLCSLAVIQWSTLKYLKIPAQLFIGAEEVLAQTRQLPAVFRVLAERGAKVREDWYYGGLKELETLLNISSGAAKFLWLPADSLERASFQRFFKDAIQGASDIFLHCPSKTWLSNYEAVDGVIDLNSWSDTEVLSLIYYLASSRKGGDIDLNTPRCEEKGNIIWYINSASYRAERVCGKLTPPTDGDWELAGATKPGGQQALDLLRLRLLLRLKYIGVAFEQAGSYGEVTKFLSLLQDFLDCATAAINTALLGKGAVGQARDPLLSIVLFGVRQALSDMLERCDCKSTR